MVNAVYAIGAIGLVFVQRLIAGPDTSWVVPRQPRQPRQPAPSAARDLPLHPVHAALLNAASNTYAPCTALHATRPAATHPATLVI